MAKVKNPVTFSRCFDIDPNRLKKLGVLDPTLAIDTKLFLDPLLFKQSIHPEIHDAGVRQYRKHFETIIKFLAEMKHAGDVAWRAVERLLEFHEIKGTCLGYGAASISGSAFGQELTGRLLRVGKEIVDLGIQDPDLFPVMALFEAKIGSDRISDMATNVIREALATFNRRVLRSIGLRGEAFDIGEVNGQVDFKFSGIWIRRSLQWGETSLHGKGGSRSHHSKNPHKKEISVDLLTRILRQASIEKEKWIEVD